MEDELSIAAPSAVLQCMLHHIVPVLVAGQFHAASQHLVKERGDLHGRAVFDEPLDDPASITMLGHPAHLSVESLHDEINFVGGQSLYALLYHVIPMLVLDAFENVSSQLANQQHLLLDRDRVQSFLDDTAPVHLQRKLEHLPHELLCENSPLLRAAVLKKLLYHVVTEDVRGELRHPLEDGLERHLLFLLGGDLELLLYESGTVLILRDLANMPAKFAQFHASVSQFQLLYERTARMRFGPVGSRANTLSVVLVHVVLAPAAAARGRGRCEMTFTVGRTSCPTVPTDSSIRSLRRTKLSCRC
mmetsp:Transcript_41296/g.109365  ORF Transcript_41296/g.109365 Transcript_41296/m.109365 type:complete len:303 (-) Transcript_41296:32-940(-)